MRGLVGIRVLLVHNSYQFAGGEDHAVEEDLELLRSRGHETYLYRRTHDELAGGGTLRKPWLAMQPFWSRSSYKAIRKIATEWRPDVAHFHNTVPLVSPSGYAAAHAAGVPVVQTLHNYRLICPAATLLRDGAVCEVCVGHVPLPSIQYRCYRGSLSESIVMASSITTHRAIGTWSRGVDAYIALTEFGKQMFVRGGLPAERIHVRPNSLEVPTPAEYRGPSSAIFVGRLSIEKGLRVLLEAWSSLPEIPLTIIGEGPLEQEVRGTIAAMKLNVQLTGQIPHDEVLERIRGAGMLIFPSIWYEGLGYALIEALALGVPVIASRLGAPVEVVPDGVAGLLFTPGDAAALAASVLRLRSSPELAQELAKGARSHFLKKYSPNESYARLMDVYEWVLGPSERDG